MSLCDVGAFGCDLDHISLCTHAQGKPERGCRREIFRSLARGLQVSLNYRGIGRYIRIAGPKDVCTSPEGMKPSFL